MDACQEAFLYTPEIDTIRRLVLAALSKNAQSISAVSNGSELLLLPKSTFGTWDERILNEQKNLGDLARIVVPAPAPAAADASKTALEPADKAAIPIPATDKTGPSTGERVPPVGNVVPTPNTSNIKQ